MPYANEGLKWKVHVSLDGGNTYLQDAPGFNAFLFTYPPANTQCLALDCGDCTENDTCSWILLQTPGFGFCTNKMLNVTVDPRALTVSSTCEKYSISMAIERIPTTTLVDSTQGIITVQFTLTFVSSTKNIIEEKKHNSNCYFLT